MSNRLVKIETQPRCALRTTCPPAWYCIGLLLRILKRIRYLTQSHCDALFALCPLQATSTLLPRRCPHSRHRMTSLGFISFNAPHFPQTYLFSSEQQREAAGSSCALDCCHSRLQVNNILLWLLGSVATKSFAHMLYQHHVTKFALWWHELTEPSFHCLFAGPQHLKSSATRSCQHKAEFFDARRLKAHSPRANQI